MFGSSLPGLLWTPVVLLVIGIGLLIAWTPLRFILPVSLRYQVVWRRAQWRSRRMSRGQRLAYLTWQRYLYFTDLALAFRRGIVRNKRLSREAGWQTMRRTHRFLHRALGATPPATYLEYGVLFADYREVELAGLAWHLSRDAFGGDFTQDEVMDFFREERSLMRRDPLRFMDHADRLAARFGSAPFDGWPVEGEGAP